VVPSSSPVDTNRCREQYETQNIDDKDSSGASGGVRPQIVDQHGIWSGSNAILVLGHRSVRRRKRRHGPFVKDRVLRSALVTGFLGLAARNLMPALVAA
jgi:hypothetical protein